MARVGVLRCLGAAVLFGASAPAASVLAGEMPALLLAGLLYLGAANPIPEVCSLMAAVCVSILFALGMIAVSVLLVSRRSL